MTNEYYAVIRSTDDHLAHYGIKGMRWGVRKAIAKGNSKALDRHFRKAARKLAKLQDIGLNRGKYVAKAAGYGAAAIGSGIGTAKIPNYTSKYNYSIRSPIKKTVPITRTKIRKMLGLNDSTANKIGLGVGLATTAGLGAMAGVNAYRAANSRKYREKAVNFKNEMDNLFRGTKYQGKYVAQPRMPKSNNGKKRKRRM